MKQALGFKITMLSQNRSVETPLKSWRFQLGVMPCALEYVVDVVMTAKRLLTNRADGRYFTVKSNIFSISFSFRSKRFFH